jgi:hypothetical protein
VQRGCPGRVRRKCAQQGCAARSEYRVSVASGTELGRKLRIGGTVTNINNNTVQGKKRMEGYRKDMIETMSANTKSSKEQGKKSSKEQKKEGLSARDPGQPS